MPAAVRTPVDLVGLQHWLQAAVLHTVGPDEDGGHAAAEVLTPSVRLAAGERLDVYRRGYRLRLLGCLRSCFPALHHLLGPEAFDALAAEYLNTCPSRSWTLDRFADGFAARLATTRPDQDQPGHEGDPWVQLIIELAEYERAFAEVYDADAVLARRVLACRYPVHGYAAAVSRGEDPVPPNVRPVLLLLHRREHSVHVTELTEAARHALAAVRAGRATGTAPAPSNTVDLGRPDRAGPPPPPSPSRHERPEPTGADV